MRFSRFLMLVAAIAAANSASAWAGDFGNVGGAMPRTGEATVSPAVLNGSPAGDAQNVEVFYGRWRPYWRGFFHGSAGLAPRPNLLFGPIIYPRFFAFQPFNRFSYANAYAFAVPCSGGGSMTFAPGAARTDSDPMAVTPAMPLGALAYRHHSSTTGPANGLVPPETPEPPLALGPGLNRAAAKPANKPAGFVAYGESPCAGPAAIQVVKGRD